MMLLVQSREIRGRAQCRQWNVDVDGRCKSLSSKYRETRLGIEGANPPASLGAGASTSVFGSGGFLGALASSAAAATADLAASGLAPKAAAGAGAGGPAPSGAAAAAPGSPKENLGAAAAATAPLAPDASSAAALAALSAADLLA